MPRPCAILKNTARKPARVALVEKYAKAQGLCRTAKSAGSGLHRHAGAGHGHGRAEPGRPDAAAGSRARWPASPRNFAERLINTFKKEDGANKRAKLEGTEASIGHGDVVIAAITSCTNTSNPDR